MKRTISSLFVLLLIVTESCNDSGKPSNVDSTGNPQAHRHPGTIGCGAPAVTDEAWYRSGTKAPLFDGLGGIHFAVSTSNLDARQYFQQGLMLSYAFNHAEAARSFFEAGRRDTTLAMAWWGFAYVLGPNYNGGMEKDNLQRAVIAVRRAQQLCGGSTPKEKELIEALATRYSSDTLVARGYLDSMYAAEMRTVYRHYPQDPDVASLFAESLMDLHPWNLWKKDGSVQPWTVEILAVLEQCLQRWPKHAGANHFYIHATEMSAHAEVALPSARLFQSLVPGAGHLLHMPSHTYIRVGQYHEGVLANMRAMQTDSLYVDACHAQGVYPLAYYPHNAHFMSACATLDGESVLAMSSALATSRHAHRQLMRDPAWATLQHYYTIPWYVQVKLGLWKDILQSSPPEAGLPYPSVIWHYATAMAMLSAHRIDSAKVHLGAMRMLAGDESLKQLSIWGINNLHDLSMIAVETLQGEILAVEKDFAGAIRNLRSAVAREDALNYNEPPDWFFSVRHQLGAVMLEAGMAREAVAVYEADLQVYKNNGWALRGLMNAFTALNDPVNYQKYKKQFDQAWQYADITINSSRIR